MKFELKLTTGEVVTWEGADGIEAMQRYADAHPGTAVIAWRWPRYGLFVGLKPIIEPGHFKWGRPRNS